MQVVCMQGPRSSVVLTLSGTWPAGHGAAVAAQSLQQLPPKKALSFQTSGSKSHKAAWNRQSLLPCLILDNYGLAHMPSHANVALAAFVITFVSQLACYALVPRAPVGEGDLLASCARGDRWCWSGRDW